MSAAIVDGHDLDILVAHSPVELHVLDTQIWKVDLVVEVRQVVVRGPLLDLVCGAIRVSVMVITVPVALVQPSLIVALELVVEDDAFDACVPLGKASRGIDVGVVDLHVVFELAFAFES